MPPRRGRGRGRGRPAQSSRMSAAIEAMEVMGFDRKLVRQKVNRLLKDDLYGDEGWRFIEEASYSVLLEALLEEQEQPNGDETNGSAPLEHPKDGEHAESAGVGASSSKVASPVKSCCGDNSEISGAGILSEVVSGQTDASRVNEPETLGAEPSRNEVASVENDSTGGSEVAPSEPIISCPNVLLPCSNPESVNKALQSKDDLENEVLNNLPPAKLPDVTNFLLPAEVETKGQEGIPVSHSTQRVDALPAKMRKPYHGWIGSKDDNFVILEEMPFPDAIRKLFNLDVNSGKRKRKSRWDVKPAGM